MRLLVAEDYGVLRQAVAQALREAGYVVDESADGDEAVALAHEHHYDVVVLDIMLPSRSGYDVLAALRRLAPSPCVIFVTARDQVHDRVRGLDQGADDYLVKPFDLSELVSRVRALVRRKRGVSGTKVRVDDLEVDLVERVAWRGGQELMLSPREFSLLELLAVKSGRVVGRAEIQESLYGDTEPLESNVIDAFIRLLRKKVERDGRPRLIHTRRGEGYVLRTEE